MKSAGLFSEQDLGAARRCEDACRALATVCMDATATDRQQPLSSDFVARAIDCAYVAGTTARLVTRADSNDVDSVAWQLLVCERVALFFADLCEHAVGPGVAICADLARECASSCAEMRDTLADYDATRYGERGAAPRRDGSGSGDAAA